MIKATMKFAADPLYDSKRFRTKFNTVFQGIGAEVQKAMAPIVIETFSPPGAVVYPIQWASAKQRRAFFATDGFGRGIPTKRTGKVNSGWTIRWVSKKALEGTLELFNAVTYARYVYGGFSRATDNQQPFHKNTGWVQAGSAKNAIFEDANKLLVTKYDEALRLFAPELRGEK
jgi:hypothetical protein